MSKRSNIGSGTLLGLVIACGLATTAYASNGYQLDTCYTGYHNSDRGVPDMRARDNYNLCSASAAKIYDKALKTQKKNRILRKIMYW